MRNGLSWARSPWGSGSHLPTATSEQQGHEDSTLWPGPPRSAPDTPAARAHGPPLLTHTAHRCSPQPLCRFLSSVETATILKGGLNKRSIVPAGQLRTELGQTPLKSQRQLSAPPPTAMVACGLGLSSTYIITFMILGAPWKRPSLVLCFFLFRFLKLI